MQISTTKVSCVQWLGPTLRIATLSTTYEDPPKGSGRERTSRTRVTVVDLVASTNTTLLNDAWKNDPVVDIRACPHGRYLLVVPSEGATQVWNVPIGAPAVRVRMLPLQFTALAWVAPTDQVRTSRTKPAHCVPQRVHNVSETLRRSPASTM